MNAAVPQGLWIAFGLFVAFMLILIEVQLYSIRGLLMEIRNCLPPRV
ncbi:MAG: hypothetical protein ABSG52_14460 [Terriglobales bacterium]|jgi:hypothetical protein